jgi:hypothetical protein
MTDQHVPDETPSSADALIAELRAFTEGEADALQALAAQLGAVRASLSRPSFDRDAIWARVGERLRARPESGGERG